MLFVDKKKDQNKEIAPLNKSTSRPAKAKPRRQFDGNNNRQKAGNKPRPQSNNPNQQNRNQNQQQNRKPHNKGKPPVQLKRDGSKGGAPGGGRKRNRRGRKDDRRDSNRGMDSLKKMLPSRLMAARPARPKVRQYVPPILTLCRKGGDVDDLRQCYHANEKTVNGETPLYIACMGRPSEFIEALLSLGESPNVKCGKKQRTPMHRLALQGRAYDIKVLLQYGANPNLEDAKGETPLALAKRVSPHEGTLNVLKGAAAH